MVEEYPHDFLGFFYLGNAVRWQNRMEQAIKAFRLAEQLRPDSSSVHANLAAACLFAHRPEEAEAEAGRLREIGRGDLAEHYLGVLRFVRGEYQEASKAFDSEMKSADVSTKSRGYSASAELKAELGQHDLAIELLERGAEQDRQAGKSGAAAHKLLSAAYLYAGRNRKDLLRTACAAAVREDSSAATLMRAGTLYSRAGLLTEAYALKKRLDALEDSSPRVLLAKYRLEGEILLAAGRPAEAVARFRLADKLDAPLRHREYLAHALASAGENSEALFLYRRLMDSPELVAHIIDSDSPGILTGSLPVIESLARLCGQEDQANRAARLYESRRGPRNTFERRN